MTFPHRALAVALAVVSLAACASGGRVGETRYHDADYDVVWQAALAAVADIGARVKVENRSMGAISATMTVDAIGSAVDLEISVDKEVAGRGAEVQVRAVDRHAVDPDADRIEDLELLESQYLDLVEANVASFGGRGRGGRMRPY
jgi:uncharacterized lipoprotein